MEENGLDTGAIALIFGGIIIVLGAAIFIQKNLAAGGATPSPSGQAVGFTGTTQGSMATESGKQTVEDKLQIQDTQAGTGNEATAGAQVTVNYVGMLPDGKVFDSSLSHNQPFTFKLGAGQVIQGWDQGVLGMKVGGKRRLIVPPSLGYGSQAQGPIPANSTLVFDVELLKVE